MKNIKIDCQIVNVALFVLLLGQSAPLAYSLAVFLSQPWGAAEHGLHTVYISKLAKISFLICRRVAFGRHGSGKVLLCADKKILKTFRSAY